MSSSRFSVLSGLALCLAGACYLLDTALDSLAPTHSPGLGALVPILGLIGFPALWLSLDRREDPVALAAYLLAMLGMAGLAVVSFMMNRLLPELPEETKAMVIGALGPEFIAIALIFLVSALLMSLASWRSDPAIRLGAIPYLLGAILVAMRPILPPAAQVLDSIMIGLALLIWGYHLLALQKA